MKQFGGTMVLWDFHTRQPKKVFQVPGAPLEIRWAWGEKHNYAFTATALTSKLWLVYEDDKGEWQAKEVATIGDAKGGVLPVDISLSADDQTLFVDCFGDGKCRVFDVSNPHQPKQIYEKQIGKQLNMVSQSWDGKRLYFSSSLLARWDKEGDDNEQFLRAYDVGRQGTEAEVRSRFHRAQTRPPAPHALRLDENRRSSQSCLSGLVHRDEWHAGSSGDNHARSFLGRVCVRLRRQHFAARQRARLRPAQIPAPTICRW